MSKRHSPQVLALGTHVQQGKYRIDGLLSQSAVTQTYKATHCHLGHQVTIKTLNQRREIETHRRTYLQRFITAAQQLAQFQHPNVVRINDLFVEADRPYMVMDHVVGQSLADAIASQPFPQAQALTYIRQLGQAVAGMHQHQWLHRDLQPANILLHPNTQTITLVNLGLARALIPEHTGPLAEGYAPLEQYVPRHHLTPATDIYALAAILYALLTGRKPVPSVLRDQVPLHPPRQLNPQISPQVEQAILLGMAVQASERPATVEAWLDLIPALSAVSSSQSLDSRLAPPPTDQPQQNANRSKQRATSTSDGPADSPTPVPLPPKQHTRSFPRRALSICALLSTLVGISIGGLLRWQRYQQFAAPSVASRPAPPIPQEAFPPRIRSIRPQSQPAIPLNSDRPSQPTEANNTPLPLNPATLANVDVITQDPLIAPPPIVPIVGSHISAIPEQTAPTAAPFLNPGNRGQQNIWSGVLPTNPGPSIITPPPVTTSPVQPAPLSPLPDADTPRPQKPTPWVVPEI